MRSKRIAFFLDGPTFGGGPFYREPAVALAKAGVHVDVYRPSSKNFPDEPITGIPLRTIDFNPASRRDTLKLMASRAGRGYDLYIGTPPNGLILSAALGRMARKPNAGLIDLLMDAKRLPDGPVRKKMLAAHRRSSLSVMTDACRIAPLESYAEFNPKHRFFELPGCPAGELPRDDYEQVRREMREKWRVPQDACVVLYMGIFNEKAHLRMLFDAVPDLPENTYLVVNSNSNGCGPTLAGMADLLETSRPVRIIFDPQDYSDIYRVIFASDIGVAFYHIPGVMNAEYLGKGSQKLCMFLRAHVPALVSDIGKLEWVEKRGCGHVISTAEQIPAAVRRIMGNYGCYVDSARRAYEEEVRFERYYPPLEAAIMELIR